MVYFLNLPFNILNHGWQRSFTNLRTPVLPITHFSWPQAVLVSYHQVFPGRFVPLRPPCTFLCFPHSLPGTNSDDEDVILALLQDSPHFFLHIDPSRIYASSVNLTELTYNARWAMLPQSFKKRHHGWLPMKGVSLCYDFELQLKNISQCVRETKECVREEPQRVSGRQ